MLRNYLFVMMAGFLLWNCGGGGSQEQEGEGAASEEGMAQFADDAEFRNAHETPGPIELEGLGQMIEFDTPDGKKGRAYALAPSEQSSKFLLVFHEWWGLNDHIKAEAEHYFKSMDGVNVLAVDIYDGQVTANPDEAGKIMQSIKPDRSEAILKGVIGYAGPDASIGTIGWCFGGGQSLQASILAGAQGKACIMYYGMPVEDAKALAPLQAPVLGIFAKSDGWINEEVVSKFDALCKATGKSLEVKWFDGDHAFANPSSPGYNGVSAQEANRLALAFLQKNL